MARHLARAAQELREAADRRRYEVSSSPTDRVDPSTIYRFEKGRWPENADRVIDLYAADLELEPIEIWARALELWRASEADGGDEESIVVDVAARLAEANESPPRKARGSRRTPGAGRPRKRA